MTTDPRTILAEIRARAEAATEGPWSVHRSERTGTYVTRPDLLGIAREWSLVWQDGDAEFIAASRTDLPALLAAVEAVMGLHSPIERRDGPVCDHCLHSPRVGAYPYPCPTVQALTAPLEVEG